VAIGYQYRSAAIVNGDAARAATGTQVGYARVSPGYQSLDQQVDALIAAGVDGSRINSDKLSGVSTCEQVGIDRLGRNAAEVTTTIRECGERGIVMRSLREESTRPTPRGGWSPASEQVWPSLNWSWAANGGHGAREARRARGQSIGRPTALDKSKVELARRMHASGEPASIIAKSLGVSRATIYRVVAV
jgi:DNA invertase Pin-like site-specific DNA recombinase